MSAEILHLHLQQCLGRFRKGELSEADLVQALELAGSRPAQQLLYLQASSTGVGAQVIGISLISQGKIQELPADPAHWPYQTVLEAMVDGWRVIKFPELALLLQEDRTLGMGCEFVLEK